MLMLDRSILYSVGTMASRASKMHICGEDKMFAFHTDHALFTCVEVMVVILCLLAMLAGGSKLVSDRMWTDSRFSVSVTPGYLSL